jgi:5'-nucleotidase
MSIRRILISNDDGVHAAGLRVLREHFAPDYELWVVAPISERSAHSHAISLHSPLRITQHEPRVFSVDGHPADCVYLALYHLMPEPPDLVLSGINAGANIGGDVLYSGTVAVAMEAAVAGYPAVAVSLCLDVGGMQGQGAAHYDTAARYARCLAPKLLQDPLPPGVVLNINVPNLAYDEIQGTKVCRLSCSRWRKSILKREDPRGRSYYWIEGERQSTDLQPDSDQAAIRQKMVSLTPLQSDWTDPNTLASTARLCSDL